MTEFKNKNENIDNLLRKFYSPDQAEEIKNDFASADALFEKFPAPKPSRQTTVKIEQKIVQQLKKRKHTSWKIVLVKTAAVAASVVIISAVMLLNYNRKDSTPYAKDKQQASLWQSDTDISTFEAEINQLENELLAINLGEENGTNGVLTDRVEQVELEIIETENTFWKG
jgi:hypothetical protein